MQEQTLAPAYGMTKTEYAQQLKELERRTSQRSTSLFTQLRKKFR